MHALLVSLGTDGDIYPYLGLGEVLRQRGHRVTLVANEPFAQRAADRGLEFHTLVTSAELDLLYANPDFWHPLRSGPLMAQWGTRQLRQQFELLHGLIDDDTLLVANPGALAGRLLHETRGTPLVSLVLQPGVIPSSVAPPVMPGGLTLPRWAPQPVGWLYWRGLDVVGNWLVGRELNQFRADLGLPPVRRFFQWWNSPQKIIGMFPAWYGPPQADWPPQLETTAFPRPGLGELPCAVQAFCAAGEPPIAFTFGTGMKHARAKFAAAVEACQALGRRGILLTNYSEQLLPSLPASVIHVPFAPFAALFPRCAAVVHHGGVGTTAAALAAGVPQIALPFAFDQEDNGARITRLGVGEFIKPRRLSATSLAESLRRVLAHEVVSRCREAAALCSEDGLELAADIVQRISSKQAGGESDDLQPPRVQ
ncbi:MAG: glycosyltransferase [Pirellulales bacterium]